MILAKVASGKILIHYEGDESEITFTKDEKGLIVAPMPDWAVELRENNLKAGVATEYLEWNYSINEFERKTFEPDWELSLKQTLMWIRLKRNKILQESDSYFSVPDRPVDEEVKATLLEYRQKLRDVTTNPILTSIADYESFCKSMGRFPIEEDVFPYCAENIKPIVASSLSYFPILDGSESELLHYEEY